MKLILRRAQCEDGQLPPFCMRCGAPATALKRKRFVWRPPSDLVLALFFCFVCFPVGLILWIVPSKRRRVHVPLCNNHTWHWLWRRVIFTGILVVYALIVVIEFYRNETTGQQLEGVHIALFVAAFWLLLLFPLTWSFVSIGSLRATSITEDEITLDGVANEFVNLVEMKRA